MAFWDKLDPSGYVEDRRGMGIGLGAGALSVGIIFILGFFGVNIDPQLVNQLVQLTGVGESSQTQDGQFQGSDSYETFTKSVLGSTDTFWTSQFQASGSTYEKPRLVLFRDATQSGCGLATSQVGPHYCPADNTIYLDETFFDVLVQLGGSNGDVAQAYVLAHEVGHHVQNLTGTLSNVQNDPNYGATGSDSVAVKLELQADCYAGLWARSVKDQGIFENENEINEAISAAEAVGDDRIQSSSQEGVNPETWTHGSAEQRVEAFKKGYASNTMTTCSLN